MKRICLLAFIISLIFPLIPVCADTGIGIEEGLVLEPASAVSFISATIRSDEYPWTFTASAAPFDPALSATADNWFVYEELSSPVNYYIFWGISAGLDLDDLFAVNTGARVGAGINWFVLDSRQLEFYVQAAWNPYAGIKNDEGWEAYIEPLSFPLATGARWWFR